MKWINVLYIGLLGVLLAACRIFAFYIGKCRYEIFRYDKGRNILTSR